MPYMNKSIFVFFAALLSAGPVWLSCTHTTPPPPPTADTAHPGMHKIAASGTSFTMGTDDSLANIDEKPAMPVSFSYDYWLDTTEVTQAEYYSVTGVDPVSDTSAYGKGTAYPVYRVSWFDAALFCNAKSKKLGLDTVYTYIAVQASTAGSAYNLVGLRIHYDLDGIRLPTEAEWEYAAREASSKELFTSAGDSGTASLCAWYLGNSNGTTHPVASKIPNSLGLYDMAGNVFEWTGDWKGPHVSRAVTNPIGSRDHDNELERVIKGGSFEHNLHNLRPTARSATYPTAASSSCEYVGFRCARGIIPAPEYVSADTSRLSTNPVDLTMEDMRPILGTSLSKLVFVNVTVQTRTLCYVDYSEPHPQVHEYTDARSVYLPAISPDGRLVAFCTRNIGFGDSSTVCIRSLDSTHSPLIKLAAPFAYVPRWWVNPSTLDTFLVYTSSSIDNNQAEWNGTATYAQKISGGVPAGSPDEIVASGSFHDGVSCDGRYIVTGYTRLLMKNLQTGEQRQLFVSPLNGKPSNGSTQVCNASICPDSAHPDRCMFLDFGAPSSSLVGGSYGVHQYIFIADYSGNVVSWLKYPDEENAWDYPRWSNNGRFAAATARNATDESRSIYGIDLLSSGYRKIVSGISLEHPCLWVGNIPPASNELDIDSLGRYDDPLVYTYQIETAMKMELFWKNHHDAEGIFLGSSQTANGIDCSRFTGIKVLNMGYAAGGIEGLAAVVRDYVLPNCPRIKLIGFSATPYWLNEPNGDVSWNAGIAKSKGYLYDLHHNFWKLGKPQGFDTLMTRATHYFSNPETCGLVHDSCRNWGGDMPSAVYGCTWSLESQQVKKSFDSLEAVVSELNALKIAILVINFPESPGYKNTPSYSNSGLSWETGRAVMQKFKSFEQLYPYYHFYDAYNDGNHDYADSEATNVSHLCPAGAKKLSARLDSLIHTFMAP
jgi:uncharacterized protein (TIGR02171 family)